MKIATPSVLPGGLEAQVGAHFGHCDCYTLVDVEDGAVVKSEVIPSCAHEHGGCLAPVNYLADRGVTVLLAGGMGMRPLMGFLQEGVDVIVADDDLLAGAHGARKRCGDAGLACAALAAQYDDLMHDGLPRKGC